MIWPDILIAICNLVLGLPAFKMLLEGTRPSRMSCAMLAIPLTGVTIAMGGLGLWLSTVLVAWCVLGWTILGLIPRGERND